MSGLNKSTKETSKDKIRKLRKQIELKKTRKKHRKNK